MRSGVCGQRGSGGNAFKVAALAMPTRSAPSSFARFLTKAAFSSAMCTSPHGAVRAGMLIRLSGFILSLKQFGCEARGRQPALGGDRHIDRTKPFDVEAIGRRPVGKSGGDDAAGHHNVT